MNVQSAGEALSEEIGAQSQLARAASFAPALEDLRSTILESSPHDIARRSGAAWDDRTGAFSLALFGQLHHITWPDLFAYADGSTSPVSNHLLALFLYYLSLADGAPRAGRWISFRELPDGWLYHSAFHGYTGKVLASSLNNDASALRRAAAAIGGLSLELGDVGFEIVALPKVHLAVVYWLGDDEFDADAKVLFDASASHYLTTDGLAILGSQLVRRLLDQL